MFPVCFRFAEVAPKSVEFPAIFMEFYREIPEISDHCRKSGQFAEMFRVIRESHCFENIFPN